MLGSGQVTSRARVVIVFVSLVIISASCATDSQTTADDEPKDANPPSAEPTSPRVEAIDGPVLRYPEAPESDDEAAEDITGVLEYDAQRECLWIRRPLGGDPPKFVTPIIWPYGTTWVRDPPTVVLPSGDTVRPGQAISGGGGTYSAAEINRLVAAGVGDRAAECGGSSDEISRLNPLGAVEVRDGP